MNNSNLFQALTPINLVYLSVSSLESVYAVGDPIYARDLWLVIEFPSDGRGRRTKLGRRLARHVCQAVRAGQAVGWTPLVVGGRSTCCR